MLHIYQITVARSGFAIYHLVCLILAVPDEPRLVAPSSLIENQELLQPITCTSHVGYPPGNLRFKIKPRGHTTFFPLQEGTSVTSGTCGTNKTVSLMYTPTKDANGTLLKCVVENKHVPHAHDLSSVIELKVIPGKLQLFRVFTLFRLHVLDKYFWI